MLRLLNSILGIIVLMCIFAFGRWAYQSVDVSFRTKEARTSAALGDPAVGPLDSASAPPSSN